jgi:ribonuclease G
MSGVTRIDEILIATSPGEVRAALVSEGRLAEVVVERQSAASLVGNVYLGRVGKVVPSMDASFVELGIARAGFLAGDDARNALSAQGDPARSRKAGAGPVSSRVNEGEAVLVQVTKDAFARKGPRLSTAIALPGHWLVYTSSRPGLSLSRRISSAEERARLEATLSPHLEEGEGVILRTAAEGVEATELLGDLMALRKAWGELLARAKDAKVPALLLSEPDPVHRVLRDHAGPGLRRVFCDTREVLARAAAFLARVGEGAEAHLHQGPEPLFARHDVEDQIARALDPVVELPSGGSLAIGTLEALTAIDVNSGRHTSAGRFADAILAVNLEAAQEIARQIRLRNLAGLIVIDFVHMDEAGDRTRVTSALRAALAGDPVPAQLGGMTPLGLFEMTRKRVRESLRDALMAPCDACGGAGWLKSPETVAYEILRAAERAAEASGGRAISAIAAADVVAVLEEGAIAARTQLEGRLGRPLGLRVEPGYGREQFDIVAD